MADNTISDPSPQKLGRRMDYSPPAAGKSGFHCVHCGVFAQQNWFPLVYARNTYQQTGAKAVSCAHCKKLSYWVNDHLVYPVESPIEPAHPDLPPACFPEYEEARAVFVHSTRASAALIRLAIQKLLPILGAKGKNINDDINTLVKKGLPIRVQQALDVCRVAGNNAVHPGELDLNDTPEIAQSLFRLLNIIIEEMITKPREIDEIYSALPQRARDAIVKRDAKDKA